METPPKPTTVEVKRFQCRHIFTDGHRCGSPALREENFCYYHHTTRKAISDPYHRAFRQTRIELPMPEDRAALLLAIGEVLQAIANKSIDNKKASLLLWGLQVAGSNLPRETHTGPGPARVNSRTQPRSGTRQRPAEGDREKLEPVEETVEDDTFGPIAPHSEFLEPEEKETRRSLARQLLDEVEAYERRADEERKREEYESIIQAAVRDARAEAITEVTAEAYANLDEIVASVKATAIAETEARLRAEFNLPSPPQPANLDAIQATAADPIPLNQQRLSSLPSSAPLRGTPDRIHESPWRACRLTHFAQKASSSISKENGALSGCFSQPDRTPFHSMTGYRALDQHRPGSTG